MDLLDKIRKHKGSIETAQVIALKIYNYLLRAEEPQSVELILRGINLPDQHRDLFTDAIQILRNQDKIKFSNDKRLIETRNRW